MTVSFFKYCFAHTGDPGDDGSADTLSHHSSNPSMAQGVRAEGGNLNELANLYTVPVHFISRIFFGKNRRDTTYCDCVQRNDAAALPFADDCHIFLVSYAVGNKVAELLRSKPGICQKIYKWLGCYGQNFYQLALGDYSLFGGLFRKFFYLCRNIFEIVIFFKIAEKRLYRD